MSRKIGFWSVLALVTGSQIGTGIFVLPSSLAPHGWFSLFGWFVSGAGAIALAFVFAQLCAKFPKTGGPHAYVKEAFGILPAFFTGWTYWIISWVSTPAVIVASIGYLTPITGEVSPMIKLLLEIILLLVITAINIRGVKAAGSMEFIFTMLKVVPLLVIPVILIGNFKIENLTIDVTQHSGSTFTMLGKVTMLTLWGFIGMECATTPAGAVENPGKTIPRAIIIGTVGVALLYIFNSLAIMGSLPGEQLIHSKAPYVDATRSVFGSNVAMMMSIIASLVCIGTLNAWVLTSGQIALGLAEDKMLPDFFAKKNKNYAPLWSLVISGVGIVPLLILTANDNLASQINMIIDYSVTGFLFVYLICSIANIRLHHRLRLGKTGYIAPVLATVFCCWVIYETSLVTIGVASLFTLSGMPVYWYMRKR